MCAHIPRKRARARTPVHVITSSAMLCVCALSPLHTLTLRPGRVDKFYLPQNTRGRSLETKIETKRARTPPFLSSSSSFVCVCSALSATAARARRRTRRCKKMNRHSKMSPHASARAHAYNDLDEQFARAGIFNQHTRVLVVFIFRRSSRCCHRRSLKSAEPVCAN